MAHDSEHGLLEVMNAQVSSFLHEQHIQPGNDDYIGSLIVGSLANGTGGFAAVFYLCAAVYISSFITWNLFIKGEKISLS